MENFFKVLVKFFLDLKFKKNFWDDHRLHKMSTVCIRKSLTKKIINRHSKRNGFEWVNR